MARDSQSNPNAPVFSSGRDDGQEIRMRPDGSWAWVKTDENGQEYEYRTYPPGSFAPRRTVTGTDTANWGYVLSGDAAGDAEAREAFGWGDGGFIQVGSGRPEDGDAWAAEQNAAWGDDWQRTRDREEDNRRAGSESARRQQYEGEMQGRYDAERAAARADDPAAQQERLDRGEDRYGGMGADAGWRNPNNTGGGGAGGGGPGGPVGGGGGGGGGREAGLSEFDQTSADIPVWGWLSGSGSRRDAARNADAGARVEGMWSELGAYQPNANELAVDYASDDAQYDSRETDQAAMDQAEALRAMQDVYRSGGITEGDRARQAQQEREIGRFMRSQRDADQQALNARGMGGGGAAVASMLNAQQSGVDALASRDAQIQIDAQQRALQAMQASGQQAGQIRSAADDFNRWASTSRASATNRTRESRSNARQQAYENTERRVQGATGRMLDNQAGARQDQARQAENDRETAGAIGSVIEEIVS